MKLLQCDRCKNETNTHTTSWFNLDMICEDCQIEESKHPLYKKAKDTELEEVKKGNRNYPGLFGNKTWAQIKEIEQ